MQRSSNRRLLIYWTTQLVGWAAYVSLISLWMRMEGTYEPGTGFRMVQLMIVGMATSHLLRAVIRSKHWLESNIAVVLPRLALVSVLMGILGFFVHATLHDLFFPHFDPILASKPLALLMLVLDWTLLMAIWSLAYFAYHFFLRQRREEIRNLRLETANRENQLGNLRSQLNPHFMFNALNGIRALVDEDPAKAKQSITQLSAILRNSMTTVRRNTVPLGEELDTVRAYLDLEKMRFEERLRVSYRIADDVERLHVPPMMLQTLAENAVRHGIAHLTAGGELEIGAQRNTDELILTVRNSGTYAPNEAGTTHGTRIGLRNTRQRLAVLYGDKAVLDISNHDGMVLTRLVIPLVPITSTEPPPEP